MEQRIDGDRSQHIVLKALGSQISLNVSGSQSAEASFAIRQAWEFCLDLHRTKSADLSIDIAFGQPSLEPTPETIVATNLPRLMHDLSQIISVRAIDLRAGELLMLHACAFANPHTGQAVAAIASSGTGKTTLIRTLGAGHVYLTDEAVGLTDKDTIVPYPKPLSVNEGGTPLKRQDSPRSLGLLPPSVPATLRDLWFLKRLEEPAAPEVVVLSNLDALTTVAPQVSYLSALPHPLQRLTRTFDRVGGLKLVSYHEAADLKGLITESIGQA